MTVDPVEPLAAALDHAVALIGAVRDDQWELPTPCEGWDVRALVRHILTGNRLYVAALAQPPAAPAAPEPFEAPENPAAMVAEARSGAEALVGAFRRTGSLDRNVHVPFGTVPGAVALHLRITEILVHGWDLARATGQAVPFSDDVAEQEIAFSEPFLGRIPPSRKVFAAPKPAPEGASAVDRLAALLGRSV